MTSPCTYKAKEKFLPGVRESSKASFGLFEVLFLLMLNIMKQHAIVLNM